MNIYNLRFIAIFLFGLNFGFSQTSSKNTKELSLIFIGDFMGHLDQINAAYNSQNKTHDYNDCFKYVKPILSDADITIGNLEVTLGIKPYSGYPQFSSPASYASAIKNAGVDVLMTANNHSCDKNEQGINKTIEILDSLKISHTGTFISKVEKDLQSPLILIKNGFKLAFLNYTYGTNGILPTYPNIVNYLDKKIIAEDVKKYKCYQCIDFFFLQEELDCHLNLQHGVKTDKNYCKRHGNLLRGIHNCLGAAGSVVQVR